MKKTYICFIVFLLLLGGLPPASAQEDLGIDGSMFFPGGAQMEEQPAQTDETVTESAVPEVELITEEEDDGLISVDFQNTDVRQVIKVLGDITETIIIPHEGLQGTITIESLSKVKPEEVANILKSALLTKGFTLVRSGRVLKIVSLIDTKQTNVAVKIGTSPEQIAEEDLIITQVMPLQYSSALTLKTTLQPLIGKHGNVLANERTNTLVITDSSSNIKRLATIISQMERPVPSEVQVKTYVLDYGNAEKVAEILNNLSSEESKMPYPLPPSLLDGEAPLEIFGEIQAYHEEETSSIVVASAPANFPAIERVIQGLDIFPSQAMIEVVLMDVTLDDDFTMGIEFGDVTSPTLTTEGYKTNLAGDSTKESIFHSLLGLATDASSAGFTYRLLNRKQTHQALGYLLAAQENSKVLSTPRILASNNQESSITVGQEIPIIESSTTDLANNVTNVDYRYEDVGLNLKVTPRISRDGYVNLKIHAELKDLSAQTLFDASIINTREADATVMIPDGYTVVLGGLMRDNNSLIVKKIPFLGDIPILGVFFKKTTTALLKTELLIFLTPHVIQSTQDLQEMAASPLEKIEMIKNAETSKQLEKAVQKVVGFKQGKKKKEIKQSKKENVVVQTVE